LGDSSVFTNINILGAWEKLLEAIRGVGKLSLLLLGLLLHPWRFYPFWVREDNRLRNWRRRCE